MPSKPAGYVSVLVPAALCFVDDGERDAGEDDIVKVLQAHIDAHADDLAAELQDLVDSRREDDFDDPEPDESNAPYTSYEEGRALDAYERSHGW